MPTLSQLYGNTKQPNMLGEFDEVLPKFTQPSAPSPAPAASGFEMPENSPGLISATARTVGGGLAAVGNLLDLPGSSVRDTLALKNPFDQWLDPLGYNAEENRTTGRELLRDYGMVGEEDTYGNWWAGFGGEVLLDPLTYTGIGALTKAGKVAEKAVMKSGKELTKGQKLTKAALEKMNLKNAAAKVGSTNILKDARRVANETAEATAKAAVKDEGLSARMTRVMRGLGSRARMTPRMVMAGQSTGDARDAMLKAWYEAGGTEAMLDMPLQSIVSFKIPKLLDKELTILSKSAKDDITNKQADELLGMEKGTLTRETSFDAMRPDEGTNQAYKESNEVFDDWVKRNYEEVRAVDDATLRSVPGRKQAEGVNPDDIEPDGLGDGPDDGIDPSGTGGGSGNTDLPGGGGSGNVEPEATSAFMPVFGKRGVNYQATNKTFREISPKHELFDRRLNEWAKQGVMPNEERLLLQSAFAGSDLRLIKNWTQAGSMDTAESAGKIVRTPGNAGGERYQVYLNKKMKGAKPSEIATHELGHMAFYELEQSDPELFSAAYRELSEAIADGSMLDYFSKTFPDVKTEGGAELSEYLQHNPHEVFAQLFSDKAANRMDQFGKQVMGEGSKIQEALAKAWEYISAQIRRIIGSTNPGDERRKAIEGVLDFAGGFSGDARDELLDQLNSLKAADGLSHAGEFRTAQGAQATTQTMIERAGEKLGFVWDEDYTKDAIGNAAKAVPVGDKWKIEVNEDWFKEIMDSPEYAYKQLSREMKDAIDNGDTAAQQTIQEKIRKLDDMQKDLNEVNDGLAKGAGEVDEPPTTKPTTTGAGDKSTGLDAEDPFKPSVSKSFETRWASDNFHIYKEDGHWTAKSMGDVQEIGMYTSMSKKKLMEKIAAKHSKEIDEAFQATPYAQSQRKRLGKGAKQVEKELGSRNAKSAIESIRVVTDSYNTIDGFDKDFDPEKFLSGLGSEDFDIEKFLAENGYDDLSEFDPEELVDEASKIVSRMRDDLSEKAENAYEQFSISFAKLGRKEKIDVIKSMDESQRIFAFDGADWDELGIDDAIMREADGKTLKTPVVGVPGNLAKISTPSKSLPAVASNYEVVELDDLITSHKYDEAGPHKNELYPEGLQPRDYSPGNSESLKVEKFAREQNPDYWISNHPGADNGPPSISPNGVVINGNGRTMALQLAAKKGEFDWYKSALLEKAESFGVNTDKISGMKNPVLVRKTGIDAASDDAAKFAAAGNIPTTQRQSPVRTASSIGKMIDDDLITSMGVKGDESFSDAVVSDSKSARAFRNRVYNALPSSEVDQYFSEAGKLTDAGKEMVKQLALSKVIPVDTLEKMAQNRNNILNSMSGSLVQLMSLTRGANDRNIVPDLIEAAKFLSDNPSIANAGDFNRALKQANLPGMGAGPAKELSPSVQMMAEFLLKRAVNENGNASPNVFRSKLKLMAEDLKKGTGGLFDEGQASPEQIIADALGIEMRDGAKFGVVPSDLSRDMPLASKVQEYKEHWKSKIPENLASAVADTIDRGGDLFYAVPFASEAAALFRPELYGATNETGRKFGRARADAIEQSMDQYRQVIAPVVRSIHESKVFNERAMVADGLSESQAIDKLNANARDFVDYMERVKTAGDLPDDFQDIVPQMDILKTELENARKFLEESGFKAPKLDDLFVDYMSRNKVTGSKTARRSAKINPKVGSVVETATRSMKTRDIRDIPGGRSVIDEMSIDKNISGLRERANFVQKKLEPEDLTTPIEMADGRKMSLREYMSEKYGDRLFKGYDHAKFDKNSTQFDTWIKRAADFDPVHAEEQIPLFGRNPLADISRHIEDARRVGYMGQFTQQMYGKSAVHLKYATNPDSVISIAEALPASDRWADQSLINVIGSMEPTVQNAYRTNLADNMAEDIARLTDGEAIRRTVDGKHVNLKMVDGELYKFGKREKRTATPTGVLKEDVDFEELVDEDYLETFARGETANEFLKEFGVEKDIAEQANRFMKPFSEPEAVGEIEDGARRFINVMKAGLTAPWPAFHVRNAISAFYMNATQGMSDPRYKGLKSGLKFLAPYMDAYKIRTNQKIDFTGIKGLEGDDKLKAIQEEIFGMGIVGEKMGIAAEHIGDDASNLASQMPGLNPEINPILGVAAALTFGKSKLGSPAQYFSKPPIGRTWADFFNPLATKGGLTLDVPARNKDLGLLGGVADQVKNSKVMRVEDDMFAGAQYGRDVASLTEDMNRISQYVAARRNGYAPEAARDLVNKLQIDYSQLSAFESKKVRLYIPFYTFSRRMLPVVIEDLIRNPGGPAALTIKATNRARDPEAIVPDHIASTAALPMGSTSDGSNRYLTGFGLPFEDTLNLLNGPLRGDPTDTLREIGGRSNPFIKGAAELMFGRSLFQDGPMGGRELTDLNPPVGQTIANVKSIVTGSETKKAEPFPSQLGEFAVSNSPLARIATTARTLTDKRKWENPVTGLGLNLLTGVRVNDVSPQAQDAILNDRLAKALKDLGGRTYSRPYVSDDREAEMTSEEKKLSDELLEGIKRIQKRFKTRREMREAEEEKLADVGEAG